MNGRHTGTWQMLKSVMMGIQDLCLLVQSVKEAKVSNYLVVAIDTPLRDELERGGYNVYYRDVKVRLPQILPST